MPLFIKIDPEIEHNWINHPTYKTSQKNKDVGLDIPMQSSVIVPAKAKSFKVSLQFKGAPTHGYMLIPRSSISKTTVRLANSIGIIDMNYRGDVKVVLDNIGDTDVFLQEGCCYFQIVAFDGKLPSYQIEEINPDDTLRGSGGFGSTGAI
jgi:dUTP pyrophosphatase